MKGNEVGDSLVGESALVGSRKTAYGSAIDWRGASQDLFWFRGLAGLFRQDACLDRNDQHPGRGLGCLETRNEGLHWEHCRVLETCS